MNLRQISGVLIMSFFPFLVLGQTETYTVKKASFSSDKYDEFSPVYFKNGIVFCTNRISSILNYSTEENKGLFKIYYVDTNGDAGWQSANLLSKKLRTKLNDGPVTFNRRGDTVYYSRNLVVTSKVSNTSGTRNKLGIFNAVLIDGQWTKIVGLKINNERYNVTTPCLSPDGMRLFFASDKSGGYGGFDLYYSQKKDNYWDEPVNLGPIINTKGNEAYPFINFAGELFFSSDGHPGLGGMDIFFSRLSGTTWLYPVPLDAPVNSQYDDFGIISDTLMNKGYFSSKRDKSIDIYQFRTNIPQIYYADIQKVNQYCFLFNDTGAIVVDTMNLEHRWDFGNGKKVTGAIVKHSFPGPGKYNVKLDLIDKKTGNLFFSKLAYDLEIRDFEQPFITSPDVVIKGEQIDFDGLKSYLPGYKIINYIWDFGDGTKIQGERVKHSFKENGVFMVNLGLVLKSNSTGITNKNGSSKKIIVLNNLQERAKYMAENSSVIPIQDIREYKNAFIKPLYSAETDFKQDAVFQVEIISSKTKIEVTNIIFRNVPKNYIVKEIYDQETDTYSYIIDQQISLMAAFNTYKEILTYGYKEVRTKIEVLKDPAEKELLNLKKTFSVLTESYFDSNNKLTSTAYLLLDQIVKIMTKYPEIRLEVSVYTENAAFPYNQLTLPQSYAQIAVNYLTNRDVDTKRLIIKGAKGTSPITPNYREKNKNSIWKIDFLINKE